MANKIFFMDRDGTINIDVHHLCEPAKVVLIENVAAGISRIRQAGFKTVIVSNQSCIGRGYATISQVDQTMNKVLELLKEADPRALIDLVLYAPDHPDKPSERRKPGPGMIYEALKIYPGTDLRECFIVGDKISDPEAGRSAGIPSVNCVLVNQDGDRSLEDALQVERARDQGFSFSNCLFDFVSRSGI